MSGVYSTPSTMVSGVHPLSLRTSSFAPRGHKELHERNRSAAQDRTVQNGVAFLVDAGDVSAAGFAIFTPPGTVSRSCGVPQACRFMRTRQKLYERATSAIRGSRIL